MRIGSLTNSISCEYEMQDKIAEWLMLFKNTNFVKEYRVKEVNRIADFLVFKVGSGLINIEAKCTDFGCVIRQLKDHSKYCDYSFAFIPDYAPTPKWFKKELLECGFGLIVFNFKNKSITEVLEAHFNKPINKQLRHEIIKRIQNNVVITQHIEQ
jgi:hypothetical protein